MTSTAVYSAPTTGNASSPASTRPATIASRRPGPCTSSRCSGSAVVTGAAGGVPRRPCGRTASTTAITTNSATSVSLGKAIVDAEELGVPSAMHSALVMPMITAARNAPGIEPRPPTTVTTNASATVARSMPRLAGSRGSCSAPASPARNAPSANTAVKSLASSMPSAAVSARFSLAARIRMPKRVRVRSSVSATSTAGPTTMRKRSYCGIARPSDLDRARRVPARADPAGPRRRTLPAPHRAR